MKKIISLLLALLVSTSPVYAVSKSVKMPENSTSISSAMHKINLNQADVTVLTGSFKGIGKKRAQAIIAYRKAHNGFKSLDELAEVKGFGPGFLDKNREKLKEVFVLQ